MSVWIKVLHKILLFLILNVHGQLKVTAIQQQFPESWVRGKPEALNSTINITQRIEGDEQTQLYHAPFGWSADVIGLKLHQPSQLFSTHKCYVGALFSKRGNQGKLNLPSWREVMIFSFLGVKQPWLSRNLRGPWGLYVLAGTEVHFNFIWPFERE